MPQIVEAARDSGPFLGCFPALFPFTHWLGWIGSVDDTACEPKFLILTTAPIPLRRENEIVGLAIGKPFGPKPEDCANTLAQGNDTAFAMLRFGHGYSQLVLRKVELIPMNSKTS